MKPGSTGEPADRSREESDVDLADEEPNAVRRAACRSVVARRTDRVERFGASEHDRVNPAGFVFRIARFGRADGARVIGPPSLDFAWFPRAPWQIALCGACGVHLGWSFGGDQPFFGLSVDAIVESR